MCILDISKVLMYNFYYKTMKEKYGENIKLLFSDTDSICFEVKKMIYIKMWKTIKIYMIYPSIQKHIFIWWNEYKAGWNDERWNEIIQITGIYKSTTKDVFNWNLCWKGNIRRHTGRVKTYVKKEIKEKTPQKV